MRRDYEKSAGGSVSRGAPGRLRLAMAALSLLLWTQGRVRAESMESAPTPKLSWLWLGTQWLPSPEVALGSEGAW